MTPSNESRSGLLYGFAAYGFWGLVPLYFRALQHVDANELLAQRIAWSSVVLVLIITLAHRWGEVRRCFSMVRTRRTLILTTLLIAVNWYLYIYATVSHRVTEASLGYFIAPLASTALGVMALGERLRGIQIAALVLAGAGVAVLAILTGVFPWLGIGLALSFSTYGLLRKTVAADAITGLAIESLLLLPIALGYIAWLVWHGKSAFSFDDPRTALLLMAGSLITIIPLFCFAQAARRLRLTTIGFLQYLSPTGQLLIAIVILGEPFDPARLIGFGLIWAALAVYSIHALWSLKQRVRAEASKG